MNDRDNTTTLWALDVLRRYAPHPLVDTTDCHVECFRRQCARDADLREVMQPRVYEDEGRDAAEFFAAEQSPSDATFR
jgi:hypothetical protein